MSRSASSARRFFGVRVEDRLVRLDRLAQIAEARPEDRAELVVQPRDLAPVHRGLHAQPQVLREILPALQPFVEILERGERALVARSRGEELLPERDRLVEPAELRRERGHPREDPLARGGVAGRYPLAGEHAEEILAPAGALVQALERPQRRDVARVGRGGGLVRLGGLIGRGEPLLAELAEPEEQLDPLRALHGVRALREDGGELLPELEPLEQPLERGKRARRGALVERDRLSIERRRARGLPELLLVERAEPERDLRRLHRREPVELVLVDRRELLLVAARVGERLHAGAERRIGGILAERLAQREERELRIGELSLAQLGELHVQRLALERVRPLGRAQLQHGRLPRGVAAARVGVLQGRRRARVRRILLEHRLEPRDRLRVIRARGEHLGVQRERALAIEQARLEQLRQALPERHERRVVARGPGGVDLAPEHVREVDPPLGADAEPVEARERVPILRGRVEQRAQALDRARRIAEPLVLDGGELGEEGRARVRRLLVFERAPERLRERLRLAALAERRGEAGDRLAVAGGEIEQPLPRVGGGPRIPLSEARDAPLVLGACGGLARAVGVLGEQRRELVADSGRLGVARREIERLERVGVRRERPAGGEERHLRVPERPAVDAGHPAQERRPGGGLGLVRRSRLEDLDDLRVLALGGEDGLEQHRRLDGGRAARAREVLERGERAGVVRHLLEHFTVAGERAVGVGEPLVADPTEAVAQLGGLGDQVRLPVRDRDLAGEDVGEVVPPLGGAEQLPEQPERVRVLGVNGQDLPVRGHCAIPVGELLSHDLRHLEQEFLARPGSRRDVGEPPERPCQLAVRAELPVHARERAEDLCARRDLRDLLVPPRRGVGPAEPVRGHHREPAPELERHRRGEARRGERVLERACELVPGPGRRREPLELGARAGRVRAARQRALQLPQLRAERAPAIAEPLLERSDLGEER